MIEIEEVRALTQWIVLGGLLIGLGVGALTQATRFCTLGAIADAYTMGSFTRLRMWGLAVATAIVLSQGLVLAGLLDDRASLYTASRLLLASHLIGGLTFGFGMALASGCGSRMLVKMGEGSLKALVVFLVMGLVALMSIRGAGALLRVNTVDQWFLTLATPQGLPYLIAASPEPSVSVRVAVAAVCALALLLFALWRGEVLRKPAHWFGGIGLGVLVALGWALTGWLGFIPEHPETLEAAFLATNSKAPESLTFVGPLAFSLEYLLYTSDRSQAVSFAVATVLGLPIGAAVSALARGRFQWEGFQGVPDLTRHLLGGALMGFGGVTAMGCTFGHGLSGLSMLALGSMVSIVSIGLGALLGLKWLSRGS